MGWVRDNLHWLLLGGVAGVTVALVATLGFGILVVLGAMTAPAAGEPWLLGIARAAVPFVVGIAVLALLDALLVVGLVATVVRRASLPESERLSSVAARVERAVPALARAGLSDRLEPSPPSTEEQRQELKRRYVEGELTEAEFERRLRPLLASADDDQATPHPDGEFAGRTLDRDPDVDVSREGR